MKLGAITREVKSNKFRGFPKASRGPHEDSPVFHILYGHQPRSQGLFPGLGAGREEAPGAPPPSQGKDPGNEVGMATAKEMAMVDGTSNLLENPQLKYLWVWFEDLSCARYCQETRKYKQ